RAVTGGQVPEVRAIRTEQGETVLRIRSEDEAAFVYRTLDPPLDGGGSLRWRWRTSTPVTGADLREPDRDDSPLRLFVVFGAEEGRAIFYPRLFTAGGSMMLRDYDRFIG
ncbi:MAG: DUF3047 domain-containing protein, partial [Gemmatimonadota bacterium]